MKINQLLLSVVFSLGFKTTIFSQCEINATANPLQIYCGQSSVLSAYGIGAGTVIMNETFNSGFGSGWSGTPGATSFSNPCSPGGADGTPHAWMDANTSVPRTLTSTPYNLSGATAGVTICFDLLMATQNGAAPCEGPDEPDEGIYFQYSINGGATWIDIQYFDPDGGYNTPYTSWNNWCFQIPAAAITSNTMFRWHQTADSGAGYDHWGIDNVQIVQNDVNAEIVWQHDGYSYGAGSAGGNNPTSVTPTTTTTYNVQITTGLGQVCTTSVTVVVLDPVYDVNVSATPATVCAGQCATISGTAIQVIDPGGIETYENNQTETVGGAGVGTVGASVNINVQGINVNALTSGMITEVCINQFNYFSFGFPTSVTVSAFEFKLVAPGGCGEIILIPQGSLQPSSQTGGMQNVCFTVGGATNLGSVSQPYSGTYTPNQPFNNLVGCDPNGVWTLEIEAPTGITIGSGIFSGWSITFDDPPIHAPVTASWSPTTGLSNPNSINTQACPTANTNYVLTVSNGTPGCSTHQETVPITIGPCNGCTPPSVSVSPLAACDLSTLNLANAINPSSAPAILSYHSNLADAQNDANPVSTSVSTPGSYWVRAEDPADPTCYGVHEIIVTQGSIGLQVVNSTSPDCNQTNGSITVSASGGDGSYQYRINGGTYSTSPTFNNLASGNYSIEVIDGSGVCSNTIAVNLTSTSGPTITSLTSTNVTCFGSNDGTVTIVATGTGTLTYVLTDGVGFILNNTTGSFTNVPPGNYTVGVTDPSNCTFTQLVTITQGNALQLSYTTIDESCQGSCDGEINWQSTGGTAPLVVTLDGITATGGNSSALCPGNYTLVVTDNNGCSATENITISSGSGINVGSIDVVHDGCSDDCTGSITINSSNSLVYTLNGVSNTTGLFANLCGGTYELTTENSAGCSSTTSIIISSDAAPSAFFGFNPNAPTIFDSEVDFNNYSTNASLYYWEISDMTTGYFYSTSEEEFSHLFPSDTAHYNVCLIAYNLSGCSDTMCLEVIVYDDLIIYVPNTFTPDGNEFNQNLKIFANGIDRYNFNFQIFNRWGELIFETNDASTGWDGTYKGEIVQDGTYSWKMQVKQPNNDFRKMVTGYVNVLR